MGDQDQAKRQQKDRNRRAVQGYEPFLGADSSLSLTEANNAPSGSSTAEIHASQPSAELLNEISNTPYFTVVAAHPGPKHADQPWYDTLTSGAILTDLTEARADGVWQYPQTALERARCSTFRALWERGMFLGQGVKFGGEFLVYPGDPLRYHSHFVTTTIRHPDLAIQPMELVAFGRLGTATKKAHLLCCYDAEEDDAREHAGQTEFYSLEWGNFG